jgi:transcription elongation factor GreA
MSKISIAMDVEETINFGDTAKVKMSDGSVRELTLVHSQEIDVLAGKISNNSPVGQALMGAKAGEKRSYSVGERSFEIEVLEIIKAV